jgi:hypothetical protein
MRSHRAAVTAALLLLVGVLAGLVVASTGGAQGPWLADKHQQLGVGCEGCHAEKPPATAVVTATCLQCHGDLAELARRTEARFPNPHTSPHEDQPGLRCESCHRGHTKSENACTACHE